MADPASVLAPPIVDQEADAARAMVARAVRIGLWTWPSFILLDAWMSLVAFPDAPLRLFVAYRIAVELIFAFVYRASRRRTSDIKLLFWGLNVSYGGAAVAIALMAVHLGGITSPYMHGISVIALVRAALVPLHWRRSWPTFTRIALAFPIVMGLGALLSPALWAEWLSRPALVTFASNYVFVVASCCIGLASGHIMFLTREQLYRQRRIGRYRLQAPIGKGGMGEVWLAWDLSLRRNVALKLLRLGAPVTPDAVKRFEREAHATSRLRGPHIVQIFDFGASDDGLYYLAMEYLNGMDLASLVERFGPVPPARAIHVISQACDALAEAHAAGIIHRDLKPHNLFLTRHGRQSDFLKLLDFGIVRFREPDAAEPLTWTGFLLGTPAYLAPELRGGASADERSDLYALGVTLHFLLTGETPFGDLPPPRRTSAGAGDPIGPLPGLEPFGDLGAVVRRCLAANPHKRIASAHELRLALAAVRDASAWTPEDAERFWHDADRVRFA